MCGRLSRTIGLMLGLSALLAVSVGAGVQQAGSSPYTKAEFVAKMSNYFAWPHPSEYNDIWKAPLKQLKDVKTSDKYGKQIETAIEQGIISADMEGYFNPNGTISRQDAAVVFAKAFKVPTSTADVVGKYSDSRSIKPAARESVNALVAMKYMSGKTETEFKPDDPIQSEEADAIFNKITGTVVTPVQALPVQNAIAPRRYIKLTCPTPGATIYYTTDGTTPTTDSAVYTVAAKGHINEMLNDRQLPERDVVYKAIAVKTGMTPSPMQTFIWHLYRPKTAPFQHLLIQEKTATSPAIFRICSDAESVRAMAWYIEGQKSGILFDALQTPPGTANLKEYIDKYLAKVPYSLVIGHEHGDHDAQAMNFMNAGIEVYANQRGWRTLGTSGGPFAAVFSDPANQAKVKNVEEGDQFHLGGCDLHVYALPGHANGLIVLQDKANGLIFGTDIYGCTRAGSADNVAVSGVKADLLLSLAQQTYSNYQKGGGKTTRLFTGHDETPLADINLRLFEQALQQVVDKGEAGCTPTLRGNNDAPNSRTTLIGDMWKDGTHWIALKLAGIMGDSTEYLTFSPINYNGKDGYLKYAVLSNIEIAGGDLVGTTVTWQAAAEPFSWAGATKTVTNSLPNKFDPWTYNYTIKVPAANKSITIVPTSMSTKIKSMTLNDKVIDSKSSNTIAVTNGSAITIKIVAPDGITRSTYTFTIAK
jgi:glyoxylase-like metal-dependent hydrolase (beta-lactamase superfamily II)